MEYTYSYEFAKSVLVLAAVLFCCITDIRTRRIPNAVLVPMLATGLFLNSFSGGWIGLADSLGGVFAGIGMLMPLYCLGRMGAGDVKLLGAVGAVLGTWGAIIAGLATMMAGALLGLAYITWLLAKPAVAGRSRKLMRMSSNSPASHPRVVPTARTVRAAEIPYAVAIASGTVATLAYTGLFAEVLIK